MCSALLKAGSNADAVKAILDNTACLPACLPAFLAGWMDGWMDGCLTKLLRYAM